MYIHKAGGVVSSTNSRDWKAHAFFKRGVVAHYFFRFDKYPKHGQIFPSFCLRWRFEEITERQVFLSTIKSRLAHCPNLANSSNIDFQNRLELDKNYVVERKTLELWDSWWKDTGMFRDIIRSCFTFSARLAQGLSFLFSL